MKVVIDSSALAKRYIREKGTEQVKSILQDTSQLALCIITVPEIGSALNRRLREEFLTEEKYQQIKKQFSNDVHDATILQLSSGVIQRSLLLLEQHPLRAMDALHIAAALAWHTELFVTADKKQDIAADKKGLQTIFIE